MPHVLPGVIQKAALDARELHTRLRIGSDGTIYRWGFYGWNNIGIIKDPQLAEDLLASQLRPVTKEDR